MGEFSAVEIERMGNAIAGEVMELAEYLMMADPKLSKPAAVNEAVAIIAGVA